MRRPTLAASVILFALGVPSLATSQQAPLVGARADLVLLDANPLEAIANSLRINGVVVNGRWIGPAERQWMLDALASP